MHFAEEHGLVVLQLCLTVLKKKVFFSLQKKREKKKEIILLFIKHYS